MDIIIEFYTVNLKSISIKTVPDKSNSSVLFFLYIADIEKRRQMDVS